MGRVDQAVKTCGIKIKAGSCYNMASFQVCIKKEKERPMATPFDFRQNKQISPFRSADH